LLDLLDGRSDCVGAGAERRVVEDLRERIPVAVVDLAGKELVQRVARQFTKAIGVQLVERYANDPAAGSGGRRPEAPSPRLHLSFRVVKSRAPVPQSRIIAHSRDDLDGSVLLQLVEHNLDVR
jgi:hypothetical protein